jgi:thermitase
MKLLPIVACALLAGATLPAQAAATQLVVGFTPESGTNARTQALQLATAGSGIDLQRLDARVIQVPDAAAPMLLQALRRHPAVRYAEFDRPVQLAWTPNDTSFGSQWALAKAGATSAWDRARGDGVLIADLDTGVDYHHPDLAGKVALGWDFVAGDADPIDEHGHGTHVAGIAAAVTNNARGVAGMAPSARILAVRVLDANGSGTMSNAARGITYAVDNGAKVINLSLGGASGTTALRDAVGYAVGKGVVLVCAAGNDSKTTLSYPAAYDGCTSIGATSSSDARASFSNTGTGLDLVAPGVSILSTVRGTGYQSWSGTSMATPMAAGLAALLYSQGLGRSAVLSAMTSTARDLGSSGYDTSFGHGRIDAAAALASVATPTPAPTPTPTPAPPTPTPTNRAPSCTSSSVSLSRGASVSIPLRCTDADGDALTWSITSKPTWGTLSNLDAARGTVTYAAHWYFRGTYSLRFTARDAPTAATSATVSITVT